MSNYTLAVNWSGKDALADSDAAKVISGDDFNTEFTTVQTAVNSKADLNGSSSEDFAMDNGTVGGTFAVTGTTTLGGNPTTTTQSAGNNTTRIATTEFVTTAANALNAAAYPIGSIFTTTVAYANSAAVVTAIGGTTWVAFGAGKVLVGLDAGDTDFDVAGSSTGSAGSGGAKTDSHTLTTDEIPAHTHTIASHVTDGASASGVMYSSTAESTQTTNANTTTGSAHEHDIVQPYIVVYFWKRTA